MNRAGNEKHPFLFGIDFEMNEGFFIIDPLSQNEILFDVDGSGNSNLVDSPNTVYSPQTNKFSDYQFEMFPEKLTVYKKRFKTIMNGLKKGESYLANLTIETPVITSLTLKEIFLLSKSRYRLLVPDKFVCFSPECFIKIEDGKIYSFPMKGTIDANISDAENTVLNDEKEKAEHNTIVDLLRNDLSRVARDVHVSRFRYIDELKTNKGAILQVSSAIEGTLPEGYMSEIGSIVFSLLPAGSVSGAPKEATLKLIGKAENSPRRYYTGIAGYFDGANLDSFVLIRFIEQNEKGLVFRSGGGITARSDMRKEYLESLQKVYLPF
ncbi:MAG: aminodeoxychorismate synthase component I [Fermentimonas sp.]|nr:aminodeoxychorismate synthase component I [Fermentimonas sp.]